MTTFRVGDKVRYTFGRYGFGTAHDPVAEVVRLLSPGEPEPLPDLTVLVKLFIDGRPCGLVWVDPHYLVKEP